MNYRCDQRWCGYYEVPQTTAHTECMQLRHTINTELARYGKIIKALMQEKNYTWRCNHEPVYHFERTETEFTYGCSGNCRIQGFQRTAMNTQRISIFENEFDQQMTEKTAELQRKYRQALNETYISYTFNSYNTPDQAWRMNSHQKIIVTLNEFLTDLTNRNNTDFFSIYDLQLNCPRPPRRPRRPRRRPASTNNTVYRGGQRIQHRRVLR